MTDYIVPIVLTVLVVLVMLHEVFFLGQLLKEDLKLFLAVWAVLMAVSLASIWSAQ